ncbi:glycine cleavage system protein R [Ectothiorhodospiraceae bacterium BW-2]|nr:glycine cleavage system protein R [Ectothiorhodospiraceae bacterium BW-2]
MSPQLPHQLLVITALGHDRPGLIDQLTRPIRAANINILDSRMISLGGEFAVMMLTSGADHALQQLQQQLESESDRLQLTLQCRLTTPRPETEQGSQRHTLAVECLDHPGIINDLARFFSERGLTIDQMESDSYNAPTSGVPMFSVELVVGCSEAQLQQFNDYCDSLNLDVHYSGSTRQ